MRNQGLIILLALFLTARLVAQQNETAVLTKADAFSEQAGTLIEKQFIEVGVVKGVSVVVFRMKDLIAEKTITALRFESASRIVTLDSDEVDGLVKSMLAMQIKLFNTFPEVYTEVEYHSIAGFECGAYFEVSRKQWVPFVKIRKFIDSSLVTLSHIEFNQVLTYVEEAKKKM